MANILLIAATNRKGSLTRVVADYYLEKLATHQTKGELISLEELPADTLASGLYERKEKNLLINQLGKKLERYEKHIWIIPEYNGSFPGVLKVFIDALPVQKSPMIKGKKTGLIGLSAGYRGNLIGVTHFNDILRYLGAYIHPLQPTLGGISPPTRAALEEHPTHLKRIDTHLLAMINY